MVRMLIQFQDNTEMVKSFCQEVEEGATIL